ncbi:NPCBM/NEW2 domain-containing protein [Paenibacillus amylolyticus]|uniref:NPCBM/NEW2 domain-containing protein n=1 Tax=Paenibacillus amylolyticus TaxID=1451 RepID=UPI000FD8CCB6|nr:NPCBM/NEW2 domain-containing protein [Paenibacillus amylolyticus]
MGKMGKLKFGVAGFLVGTIFFSGIAWGATNKIEVSFDPVRFIVDKVDKTPSGGKFNNNGSSVPSSIIYSGTTYVPIKLIGDMIGKPVAWDGKTKSVLFGDSVAEGDYLSNKPPIKIAEDMVINGKMKIDGQEYDKGLQLPKRGFIINGFGDHHKSLTQSYTLNGQYSDLSFMYGVDDSVKEGSGKLTIIGDGKVLWTSIVSKGVPIQSASVNTSGVLDLSLEFGVVNEGYAMINIVNPVLSRK